MNFEKNLFSLIDELYFFNYELAYSDLIWRIIFLDHKKKWRYLVVRKYAKTYYIGLADDDLFPIEIENGKKIKAMDTHGFSVSSRFQDTSDLEGAWGNLIAACRKWLQAVKKDWIKTNAMVWRDYPLNRRTGILPHALVRASLPDFFRIDKELGKANTKKFIELVEGRYFKEDKNLICPTLTANQYFDYCKIAYIAAARNKDEVDKTLSGREMYKRYADGRHGGLTEIDGHSEKEFADWLSGKHPKHNLGDHPWEIKRGGNTTHIDLWVHEAKYGKPGFEIGLTGRSFTRLNETIRMFLALKADGKKITIHEPESIRKRLLAQDNIGIVAKQHSLHRANQAYEEKDDVYDVMHLDDLGRYKRRLIPFITWEPLPILRLRGI